MDTSTLSQQIGCGEKQGPEILPHATVWMPIEITITSGVHALDAAVASVLRRPLEVLLIHKA